MLKFSMLIQAIDRVTAPGKRIVASTKRITAGVSEMARRSQGMGKGASGLARWGAEVRKVTRDINTGARSLEHYQRRAERLRRVALGRFMQGVGIGFDRAAAGAGRLGRRLLDLPRRLRLVERAGNAAKRGVSWLGDKALGLAKWTAAAAGAGIGFGIFDLFKTASQFEQYRIMLEGMEGSSSAAKRSFDWVQDFAQKTPYELADAMEAFVALKAYGIDPTNGSLLAMGDAAAGMSKPLMQAVEAIADAVTGENERLKEFGIRASKEGDKVTYTYRKAGKDITKTVKATGTEIEKALTGIMSDRFGGMMARQAGSLAGLLSNLKDQWSRFLMMVADAGIFDKVKGKIEQLLARVNVLAEDGTLAAWAERISGWLERAFDWGVKFVERTDWSAVGTGLASAVSALTTIVELLGKAVGKYADLMRWRAEQGAIAAEATENSWFATDSRRKAATARRRELEAAIGRPVTETGKKEQRNRPAGKFGSTRSIDRLSRNSRWQPSTAPQLGPARNSPAGAKKLSANQEVSVGGKVAIQILPAAGLSARVASAESANRAVPIEVNTGRTMRGAA